MCYRCETSQGMYKNRMTAGRMVLCGLGLFFVICIGVACGLLATFLPDYVEQRQKEVYVRLAVAAGDNRVKQLTSSVGCTNFDAIKDAQTVEYVWTCSNSECIRAENRCDGYYDCGDKSDEDGCTDWCDKAVRRGLRFTCENSQRDLNMTNMMPQQPECFHKSKKCDGWVSCPDDAETDEDNCGRDTILIPDMGVTVTCSVENDFICLEADVAGVSPHCIPSSSKCDGMTDCRDGSDESLAECQ